MTEAEWLNCNDQQKMLEFLRGKATDRKLRLFGCACCRHIWHLLTDERSRKAVEVAEQFADGAARKRECQSAHRAAITVAWVAEVEAFDCHTHAAALTAGFPLNVSEIAEGVEQWGAKTSDDVLRAKATQAGFLHCIMGNPFRPLLVPSSVLAWNDATVVKLAQEIYDDRAFDRLPILADALEEAGCIDADILNHCRQPGEHVRGCWIVDLPLGKK